MVRHAGGIFVGEDSPEALGDYTAGPSHVMPTGGTARFSSPINVAEFTKVISVIAANTTAMRRLGPATSTLARAEGLTAHARAIERRLETTSHCSETSRSPTGPSEVEEVRCVYVSASSRRAATTRSSTVRSGSRGTRTSAPWASAVV